jgi:protein-disulfide isomerase
MIRVPISHLTALAIGLLCAARLYSAGEACAPVTEQAKTTIGSYVQKKYKLPPTATVHMTEEAVLADCYRRVRFTSDAANRAFNVSLYLSPDQRFLSVDLLDSHTDPVTEEIKAALALQATMIKGDYASFGPADAPVTIVEFSDFQCPYCRVASKALHEALDGPDNKNVRLVFRHLPLSMHPWARPAAESAACVKFQNNASFWKVHDFLFDHQPSLTAENISARLGEFVKSVPDIDFAKYQSCLENALSLGTVLKDTEAANTYQVRGTPTLFVNGKRASGIRSAEDVHNLVLQALQEAAPPATAVGGNQ